MKFWLKFLLLIFMIIANVALFANIKDTVIVKKGKKVTKKDSLAAKKDTFVVNYFYKSSLDTSLTQNQSLIKNKYLNNSLEGEQIYNPLFEHYDFPLSLGNLGTASRNWCFRQILILALIQA